MKTRTFFVALAFTILLLAAGAGAQAPAKPAAKSPAPSGQADYALPDIVTRKWTGDLDGMIKRRRVRILVPYSKTFYFVDRGTQRGLAHDVGRQFEEDLNKKLKSKHVRVSVLFVPVARDEIIPSLREGRGDIAMANLTITPERLKQVDFSEPTLRNVSEIVVTGPVMPGPRLVFDSPKMTPPSACVIVNAPSDSIAPRSLLNRTCCVPASMVRS